jgi:hypothetical protein
VNGNGLQIGIKKGARMGVEKDEKEAKGGL